MASEGTQAGHQPRGDVPVDDLSRKYGAALVRYFRRRGIQLHDAQDLAQDVFYRLARQGPLDGVESVENYLFTTAANVARDMFRRDKVRTAYPVSGFVEAIQATEQFSAERELAGKQELEHLIPGERLGLRRISCADATTDVRFPPISDVGLVRRRPTTDCR